MLRSPSKLFRVLKSSILIWGNKKWYPVVMGGNKETDKQEDITTEDITNFSVYLIF